MVKQVSEHTIHGLFPEPVYIVKRDLDVSFEEDKDIKDINTGGMYKNKENWSSINTYIFNSKLKEIKQFCEQQIKIYVEAIISPKEELDFYITQSWLNITNPGGSHHIHAHSNSIISGVFYISTEEDDTITFFDPNFSMKQRTLFELKERNVWNSLGWSLPANNNELILFPSWLEHEVAPNFKATTDRISISFNTFAKGKFGQAEWSNELILK
jgi:uncharacterized protein (TIGR02466 family)